MTLRKDTLVARIQEVERLGYVVQSIKPDGEICVTKAPVETQTEDLRLAQVNMSK